MSATEALTNSCQPWRFGISSALSVSEAKPSVSAFTRSMLAALCVTLLQVIVAVGLLAPNGPLEYRYQTLVQHDSYWFMNIMDRGYQTTVPPIDHKVMEVSNVAFFRPILSWPAPCGPSWISIPRTRFCLSRRPRRSVSGVISFFFANAGSFRRRFDGLAHWQSLRTRRRFISWLVTPNRSF
jgi:hypothetical protein